MYRTHTPFCVESDGPTAEDGLQMLMWNGCIHERKAGLLLSNEDAS